MCVCVFLMCLIVAAGPSSSKNLEIFYPQGPGSLLWVAKIAQCQWETEVMGNLLLGHRLAKERCGCFKCEFYNSKGRTLVTPTLHAKSVLFMCSRKIRLLRTQNTSP